MKRKSTITIVLILSLQLLLFSKCTVIKAVRYLYSEDIELSEEHFNGKTVAFIGLHHFGKPVFYDTLKSNIELLKNEGYTVFYEQVKLPLDLTDSLSDINLRKIRKLAGVLPTRDTYQELQEYFPNFIPQPYYDSLGIDSLDINADVSSFDLISKYEELYDEIELNNKDLSIPLDSSYRSMGLKHKMYIILNYRNEELAKTVYNSDLKKILVIYGAEHKDGFYEELRKLYFIEE